MYIYILLLILIAGTSVISKTIYKNRKNQENLILTISMLAIFLLMALKKDTVGVDIAGYKTWYIYGATRAWGDFDYVYFENGYILLTKLFSSLGCSFRMFTICMYGMNTIAWYKFMKRYSSDVTLSLFMYVCYDYFVFNISGIRQMIATALCIYAYLLIEGKAENSRKWMLAAIILNLAAASIHSSAYVFLIVIIFEKIKSDHFEIINYIVALVLVLMLKSPIYNLIYFLFSEDYSSSTTSLGGSFLLQIGITALMFFPVMLHNHYEHEKSLKIFEVKQFDVKCLRYQCICIISYFLLSGSSLLRAAMYFRIFQIVAMPNILYYYDSKSRVYIKYALYILLIFLFYNNTLEPNQLGLCPYLFFWQ